MFKKKIRPISLGLAFGQPTRLLGLQRQADKTLLITHLVTLVTQSDFANLQIPKQKDCIIHTALSDIQVLNKQISVPADLSPSEIELLLLNKNAVLLGEYSEEMTVDFQSLGPDPDNPLNNYLSVKATSKKYLDEILTNLACFKLAPKSIEPESEAIMRCLLSCFTHLENCFAVFIIDARKLKLMIFQGKTAGFVQSSLFGDDLLLAIRRLWQMANLNFSGFSLKTCYIFGDFGDIKNQALSLEEIIHTTIIFIDPFEYLQFSANIDEEYFKHQGSAFVLACGLALRGCDNV